MTDKKWSLESYLDEAWAGARAIADEISVLESAAVGDVEARKQIIKSYLFRAAETGMRLAPKQLSHLVAVQEANLVLMRLAEKGISPEVHLESAIRSHFANL